MDKLTELVKYTLELETALRIYANRDNWHEDTDSTLAPPPPTMPVVVFMADEYDQIIYETYGGEIARQVLAKRPVWYPG